MTEVLKERDAQLELKVRVSSYNFLVSYGNFPFPSDTHKH